jgi:formate hydrogenlyase subunit 6/NADH:ubiquinone oxidoreductase subunit I
MSTPIKPLLTGLRLTWQHLWAARRRRTARDITQPGFFALEQVAAGEVTARYPAEMVPVPEVGRYRLHNEIDDCIVCDLCAKICPVQCITIESVKTTDDIGVTSDGTKKRLLAPVFDIDLAKCCYCGLCTTVCPTDCLTMTKVHDVPTVDIIEMIHHFTDLTPADAEAARVKAAEVEAAKAAAKAAARKPPPAPDAA